MDAGQSSSEISNKRKARSASPQSPRQQQLLTQVGYGTKKTKVMPSSNLESLETELTERLGLTPHMLRNSDAEWKNGEFRLSLRLSPTNFPWDMHGEPEPEGKTVISGAEGESLHAQFLAYKEALQLKEAMGTHSPTAANLPSASFSEETRKQIIEDVRTAFFSWDEGKLSDFHESHYSLLPDGRILGLLMDAIYKRHFNGKFDLDRMVSEDQLTAIYTQSLDALITRQAELEQEEQEKPVPENLEMIRHNLKTLRSYRNPPATFQAKETLEVLHKEFEESPRLRALSLQERTSLIIEPYHLEMLERQGCDRSNPLLALVYNYRETFSHKVAKGWIKSESIAASKNTCDLSDIEAVHQINSGSGYGLPERVRFGAYCTREGLLRIGENMKFLSTELGIPTAVRLTSADGTEEVYGQVRDGVQILNPKTLKPITNNPIPGSVVDILEMKTNEITGIRHFGFHSGPADEDTAKAALQHISKRYQQTIDPILEEEKTLRAANSSEPVRNRLAELRKNRIRALADTYLLSLTMHPMRDGNYRLFAMQILNTRLAQQGEKKIVTFRYSAFSDGSSVDEVADDILAQLGPA